MTKGSERQYILKILEDIEQKQSFLNQILDDYFFLYDFDKQQRNFITRVVFGTIEHRLYIDFCINAVSNIKINKMKPTIRQILRMSAYQLIFMDKVPAHAAINEAVKLTQKRKFTNLNNFVNGVLRSIDRQKDTFDSQVDTLPSDLYLSTKYSINQDLIKYLLKQFEFVQLEQFLRSSLSVKDTCIHVNPLKISAESLYTKLSKQFVLKKGHLLSDSFYLSEYDHLTEVESFQHGEFQIQDESSSLVGLIANPNKSSKVLDACAAPGGKSTHMAMLMENSGTIISCDVSEVKINRIKENCERLGLSNVDVRIADASVSKAEFINAFDIVVADVPCSGLGVLRNKPDIKYNMTLDKIKSLLEIQKSILQNVKDYVKVDGELIYSTCTINQEENREQIDQFLANNANFELIDLSNEKSIDTSIRNLAYNGCIQLMTDTNLTDGFFIAKLKRIKE